MAIDYTASNGNPADPRSLHYVDPAGAVLNDYAKAMSGIGRVLEFYGKTRAFFRVVCFRFFWNSCQKTVTQGQKLETAKCKVFFCPPSRERSFTVFLLRFSPQVL